MNCSRVSISRPKKSDIDFNNWEHLKAGASKNSYKSFKMLRFYQVFP